MLIKEDAPFASVIPPIPPTMPPESPPTSPTPAPGLAPDAAAPDVAVYAAPPPEAEVVAALPAPTPAEQEETQLARAEQRLFLGLMAFRAVVISVTLAFVWNASLIQALVALASLVCTLVVGHTVHGSQLAWTRHRLRQQRLRQEKIEALERQAAARAEAEAKKAAAEAEKANYFILDEDEGASGAGSAAAAPSKPPNPASTTAPKVDKRKIPPPEVTAEYITRQMQGG